MLDIRDSIFGESSGDFEIFQERHVGKSGLVEFDNLPEVFKDAAKALVTSGLWPALSVKKFRKNNIAEIMENLLKTVINFDYDSNDNDMGTILRKSYAYMGFGKRPVIKEYEQVISALAGSLKTAAKSEKFSPEVRSECLALRKQIVSWIAFVKVGTYTAKARDNGKAMQSSAKQLLAHIKGEGTIKEGGISMIDFDFDNNDIFQESFAGTAGSFTDFLGGKFDSFDPDTIIGAPAMKSGLFAMDLEDTDLALRYDFSNQGETLVPRPGRMF
jgi:hypothetical protein